MLTIHVSPQKEIQLPSVPEVFLEFELHGHWAWANDRLERFDDDNHKTWVTYLLCCERLPEKEVADLFDQIHTRTFGPGKWLKKQYA